ncbi:MAG: DNA primase small subunit domain-containing protein, partial [Nanoarchaeota archaeon]
MISPAVSLSYYKKQEVQEAIVEASKDREVAIKYNESFGKRPDVIINPRDVWEAAKQGATSFHISVERWSDPLAIQTGMDKRSLNELRSGWDLLIDVDCQYWEYSKLIAHFIIEVLSEEKISNVGCKFSGGKGFHIIVPFEALPKHYGTRNIIDVFPDVTKDIFEYVLHKVKKKFEDRESDDIIEKTGISVFITECKHCHEKLDEGDSKKEFVCPKCESRSEDNMDVPFKKCFKCGSLMRDMGISRKRKCKNCGKSEFKKVYDWTAIMNLDAMLITSRHLFRSPYSLHEKSGLVSLPIEPDKIMSFEKEMALPAKIGEKLASFIPENTKINEASFLFENVFVFSQKKSRRKEKIFEKEFEPITDALPEELFPPCIKLTLQGIKDGKKRAAFYLMNFLSSVGWNYDAMEKKLNEWNEKNSPPLKKGYIQSQIRSHKNSN